MLVHDECFHQHFDPKPWSQNRIPKKWYEYKHSEERYEYKHSEEKLVFFAKYTCDDINGSIYFSKFHVQLKEADVVPVHKKKSKLSKESYRPISILPNFPKVYERCLNNQMSSYFQDSFLKYQCGFLKSYSA